MAASPGPDHKYLNVPIGGGVAVRFIKLPTQTGEFDVALPVPPKASIVSKLASALAFPLQVATNISPIYILSDAVQFLPPSIIPPDSTIILEPSPRVNFSLAPLPNWTVAFFLTTN